MGGHRRRPGPDVPALTVVVHRRGARPGRNGFRFRVVRRRPVAGHDTRHRAHAGRRARQDAGHRDWMGQSRRLRPGRHRQRPGHRPPQRAAGTRSGADHAANALPLRLGRRAGDDRLQATIRIASTPWATSACLSWKERMDAGNSVSPLRWTAPAPRPCIETGPEQLWFGDSRGGPQRWTLDVANRKCLRKEIFGERQGLELDPQSRQQPFHARRADARGQRRTRASVSRRPRLRSG